jgi:hypothetical protein
VVDEASEVGEDAVDVVVTEELVEDEELLIEEELLVAVELVIDDELVGVIEAMDTVALAWK